MPILPYIKGNNIYFIEKKTYEATEHFYKRCNFIANQKPVTQESFDLAVVYSNIYINNIIYGLEYGENIMKKLNTMKQKMFE